MARIDHQAVSGNAEDRLARGFLEIHRTGEVSLGKAAELAGLPVGRMITVLAEYGVESNLEGADYLKGLENLRKAW